MQRLAVWIVAVTLGLVAGRGVVTLAHVRGFPALGLFVAALVVQAVVVACAVTAMESLFPSLRTQQRRIHHS